MTVSIVYTVYIHFSAVYIHFYTMCLFLMQ